jgi:hypothetical protein
VSREALRQQSLGLVLRNHQRKPKRAVVTRQGGVDNTLALRAHASAIDLHAGLDEHRREADLVKKFERAAPNHQSLRLISKYSVPAVRLQLTFTVKDVWFAGVLTVS